ncbi:MAG: hypothetical protein AB3N16_03070 [Flavobacteriaceae bacterium]
MGLLSPPILDSDFVSQLIPQKWPMVLVDRLLSFSNEQIVSGFQIPEENLFVRNGLFEAPGIIEHMAQTVALYTGYKYYLLDKTPPTGYIGAIKKAEISQVPKAGEELVTTVNVLHDIMGVTLVTAKVECNGNLVGRSEMKTVLAK